MELHRTAIALGSAGQTNGPRCAVASRGPGSSFQRRMSGISHVMFGTHSAWPLRFGPCGCLQIVGGATTRFAAALHPTLRRDLAGSKVACLSRWRHAPLQEWADGLKSAFLPAAR